MLYLNLIAYYSPQFFLVLQAEVQRIRLSVLRADVAKLKI
jgi:hypothetical protein